MVTHTSVSTASVGSGRLHDVRLDLLQDDDLELPDGSLAYPRLVSAVAPATPPASSLGSSDGSPPRVKQPGPDTRTGFSAVELLNTPPNSAELETEIVDLRPLDTGATCETFIGYWSNAGVDVVIKVIAKETAALARNEAQVYDVIRDSRVLFRRVPRFIGLYRSAPSAEEDLYAVVTEYAGQSLEDRHSTWATLSPPLK